MEKWFEPLAGKIREQVAASHEIRVFVGHEVLTRRSARELDTVVANAGGRMKEKGFNANLFIISHTPSYEPKDHIVAVVTFDGEISFLGNLS